MPASKSPTMAWSSNCKVMTAPITNALEKSLFSETEFIAGFRAIGEERYHHKHPYHLLMHEGKLTRGQLQAWALNRYAYQSSLPRKDAAILPATRYAVEAYVHLVSTRSLLEAVASSLTELFSGKLITLRMDRLRQHYPWLSSGLDYFQARVTQAPEDSEYALAWVVRHARTREEQEQALAALRAKCDILWAMLDALYFAYVTPGWPPPGAFRPAE